MCGILAFYKKNGIDKQDIENAVVSLSAINHRGPNGEGLCLIDTRTGSVRSLRTKLTPRECKCDLEHLNEVEDGKYDLLFGHKRLSIFDLSLAGHQPMIFEDGTVIIFNGEVYNFWEIRDELKSKGYQFKTGSDTEVIVKAYKEWGRDCLKRFNGMWAIIIFDPTLKQLFVSRDRFGVKPLYVVEQEDRKVFSSEVKQFYSFRNLGLSLDREVVDVFLNRGLLDFDDRTFYNEVKRFSPGHYECFSFETGKLERQSFYQLPEQQRLIDKDTALKEYNRLFTAAVTRRLRADVKTGIAISGGVDSSAILYKTLQLNQGSSNKISTFSAVFPGMEGDESPHIKKIEKDLQKEIDVYYTRPYENFSIEDLEDHIWHQDFPTDSASYYAEWSVAKIVKEAGVTVLLGGQGGDEVFAGYHQHFYKYCRELILNGTILKYLTLVKKYSELKAISVNSVHKIVVGEIKIAMAFKMGLKKFSNRFDTDWLKADSLSEALRLDMCKYQLPWYLRSDDRDFMAFGVETRHPFLDVDLVDFGFSLPNEFKIRDGWQKWIVREAADTVPTEIRFRKDKKGYTIPQKNFEEKFNSDLMNYKSYIVNYDADLADQKFTFRHAAFGVWLKKNKI